MTSSGCIVLLDDDEATRAATIRFVAVRKQLTGKRRARFDVVRLLCRDTIEDDDYRRAIGANATPTSNIPATGTNIPPPSQKTNFDFTKFAGFGLAINNNININNNNDKNNTTASSDVKNEMSLDCATLAFAHTAPSVLVQ